MYMYELLKILKLHTPGTFFGKEENLGENLPRRASAFKDN